MWCGWMDGTKCDVGGWMGLNVMWVDGWAAVHVESQDRQCLEKETLELPCRA